MRCKICDSIINRPVWNGILRDWEVCTVCLEIINSVFEDPVVENAYTEEEEEPASDEELKILVDNPTT
jgi:hypothetical protein